MGRRYPEYTSIQSISLLIFGSALSTVGLYYAGPRGWGHSQRRFLASGGICLTIYSIDVLLDFLKYSKEEKEKTANE